jgi:hypothetical protein
VLRHLAERGRAARGEQLDHLQVLVAHPVHQPAGGIGAPELGGDVALDVAERARRRDRPRAAALVMTASTRAARGTDAKNAAWTSSPHDRVSADPALGATTRSEAAHAIGVVASARLGL